MLLQLLLVFELVIIGLRASNGRVSIIPVIVSAGPTITFSHVSLVDEKFTRFKLSSMFSMTSAVLTTLCFGIGGAFDFGTSNSQVVIFSELFDSDVDRFVFVDRLTKLEAPVTDDVCGFNIRFTTEFSTTLGDDFRGGSGGAAESYGFKRIIIIINTYIENNFT